MITQQIAGFLIRWVLSSVGMWICITLFGTIIGEKDVEVYVIAGLVFSLVNAIVKPLVTLLSLPLIVLTLGIFTALINIGMVALTIWILPEVTMDFWGAFWSSIVMILVNSIVNFLS